MLILQKISHPALRRSLRNVYPRSPYVGCFPVVTTSACASFTIQDFLSMASSDGHVSTAKCALQELLREIFAHDAESCGDQLPPSLVCCDKNISACSDGCFLPLLCLQTVYRVENVSVVCKGVSDFYLQS